MAWSDDMATDAADHVSAFGASCTYVKRVPGAFNTATGAKAHTTTSTTISMVKTATNRDLAFSGEAKRPRDTVMFSMTAAALTAAGITPDTNDRVTDADGVSWDVTEVMKRMAGALWVLQCRRTP